MKPAETININVEYIGPAAVLTGTREEIFKLRQGSTLQDLFDTVLNHRELLSRDKAKLFVAVNKKVQSPDPQEWSGRIICEGDRVMVGFKIIGG